MPDGKTVVSINFTGDNHGPHSYERVKKIYADLRKRYPQAQLVGASFNDVARELLLIKKDLRLLLLRLVIRGYLVWWSTDTYG